MEDAVLYLWIVRGRYERCVNRAKARYYESQLSPETCSVTGSS